MKMNTITKLLDCLKNTSPEISMTQSLIESAQKPIERMLKWS